MAESGKKRFYNFNRSYITKMQCCGIKKQGRKAIRKRPCTFLADSAKADVLSPQKGFYKYKIKSGFLDFLPPPAESARSIRRI